MRITVEGATKEDSATIAVFLHSMLSSWGVHNHLEESPETMPFSHIKREMRRVVENLEEPVTIAYQVTQPDPVMRHVGFDNLVLDEETNQVIVKGTWVAVDHVVSLIVDGWTWSDILRSHPELCEDDIRACLHHYLQENDMDENTVSGEVDNDFSKGYTRITGRPHPVK